MGDFFSLFNFSLTDFSNSWSQQGIGPRCPVEPDRGMVTWESEGTEGGMFHSRKLHVPTQASGLTIGRGYDMKQKNPGQIVTDLSRAGIGLADAQKLSQASGLFGNTAKSFISDNQLTDFQISQCTQKYLFDISYAAEEKEVRRICEKPTVVAAYGKTDWDKLHPAIKDVLIDLKFRGDYTGGSRQKIQKFVAENNLIKFAEAISNSQNWPNVPADRFKRRKKFINDAVTEYKKQHNLNSIVPVLP